MHGHERADNELLRAAATACVVATLAFAVYTRTLLPGVDLGDTGGFQAAVLWPETSARGAYPLYYLLARPFVGALTPEAPARGLNLFSALTAAAAVGLLSFVSAAVTRSPAAGAAAGLMLAFSYTLWTQAVIAEVYGLHLALIGACMAAMFAASRKPTLPRLAVFLAVYAVSFGNHLGMILLLVPCTVFLFSSYAPRDLLRPRIIALAAGMAIAGSLQYAPNLGWTLTSIDAPRDWSARLAAFWIDTTKADWRETMVLGVSPSEARDRLAMWWWDARQQFGTAGMLLAAAGAVRLWWISRPWAVFAWLAYAATTLFALTYNVGDTHVFLLPGHFIAAFAIAAAVAAGPHAARRLPRAGPALRGLICGVVIAYAGWRGWETYPAADRHLDRRADALVARLTNGVNERNAVLLSRLNWEAENALLYSARYQRRDLAWTRIPFVLPHLPFAVSDNQAIGRDLVLTADAAADVVAAYGTHFAIVRDEAVSAPALRDLAALPEGLPYVLTFLQPLLGEEIDAVTFGDQRLAPGGRYHLWAGVTGSAPVVQQAADRPFTRTFTLFGDEFTIRMDSWLPFDTFRRGGFGHVLRGRERVLFVERGVSAVWFREDGSPATLYEAGLYAPEPRFRIPAAPPPQLARDSGQRR